MVGIVYSLFTRDKITFWLSLSVFIACLLRAYSLYKIISKADYDILDGTCISVTYIPFRKVRTVIITDSSGASHKHSIPKATKLKVGACYRLYFTHSAEETNLFGNEEQFLGAEELASLEYNNI